MKILFVDNRRPLFYYSFTQGRITEEGNRLIHAGNKISIRKHENFKDDGYEILVYNIAHHKTPDLCEGIRQTKIVENGDPTFFYGKGYSSNKVSLSDRKGAIYWNDGMIEYTFSKIYKKDTYIYCNYFKCEGLDLFSCSKDGATELVHSSTALLSEIPYDPYNVWSQIRWYVIKSFCLHNVSWANSEEQKFVKNEKATISLNELLIRLEHICDSQAHDLFQYKDSSNVSIYESRLMNTMAIYYLLYSNILDWN